MTTLKSASARNWQWGSSNFVEWDTNCDFDGSDLLNTNSVLVTYQASSVQQCQDDCFQNPICTHFTLNDSHQLKLV